MDRFKGKTALITGGTTGIGLATAKLFINEGARVIVTGRAAATIKSAQAELGDNAIVVRSDATSFPDMDALAAKVKETFGKLDVLFVNAGYGRFIPFEAVTEEVYDEMLIITSAILGASRVDKLANTLAAVDLVLDDELKKELDELTEEYRRRDASR
jgi:NAD(P)-dependent dehydrogenase (short-subunit alcohol dehydrogenase family)